MGQQILATVNVKLIERGLLLKTGTVVDADSGLVHTVTTTAANAHDITQAHKLLHGEEREVYADSGYRGVHKREEVQEQHGDVKWHVAMMLGQRKVLDKSRNSGKFKEQLEQRSRQRFVPRWSTRFG